MMKRKIDRLMTSSKQDIFRPVRLMIQNTLKKNHDEFKVEGWTRTWARGVQGNSFIRYTASH